MDFSLILVLFFIIAFVYSTVGHGGASGYLALMVFLNFVPEQIRPTALVLNVLVSAIASMQYYRSGYFKRELFIPLILLSVPLAFLGSRVQLSPSVFKIILGICLLLSVIRILGLIGNNSSETLRKMPLPIALFIGGGIGLISGMIGIGGGILLSPVLLLFRWADIKQTAALAAPFILVNSLSGLAGLMSRHLVFPDRMMWWVLATLIGGLLGSYWGSHRFNSVVLKYLLATVLLFAAGKLLMV